MEVRVPDASAPGVPYVVEVDGDLDIATVADLEQPVFSAIEEGRRPMVLDLSECAFIDSAGIRLLLRTHRRLHLDGDGRGPDGDGRGRLLAVIARDHVAGLLRLTSVDKVIAVAASRGQAEAFFAASDDGAAGA